MKTSKSDYERVFELLSGNKGAYFPTFEIADKLGLQANTVQRSINYNLIQKLDVAIDKKRVYGSKVMSYAILGDVELPKPVEPERKRYSCPSVNCRADEFFCKENGKVKSDGHFRRFVLNGTATCTLCNRLFTIPTGEGEPRER